MHGVSYVLFLKKEARKKNPTAPFILCNRHLFPSRSFLFLSGAWGRGSSKPEQAAAVVARNDRAAGPPSPRRAQGGPPVNDGASDDLGG